LPEQIGNFIHLAIRTQTIRQYVSVAVVHERPQLFTAASPSGPLNGSDIVGARDLGKPWIDGLEPNEVTLVELCVVAMAVAPQVLRPEVRRRVDHATIVQEQPLALALRIDWPAGQLDLPGVASVALRGYRLKTVVDPQVLDSPSRSGAGQRIDPGVPRHPFEVVGFDAPSLSELQTTGAGRGTGMDNTCKEALSRDFRGARLASRAERRVTPLH
jgi:hypothetical protein